MARTARVGRARHHDGERLALTALALTQLRQRIGVRGVARQGNWKPAKALRRNDAAVEQQLAPLPAKMASEASRVLPHCGFCWPCARFTQLMCGPQSQQASGCAWKRRSSGSAYSAAQRGHVGNLLHGRCRAIIGQRPDDGEARTAVRAVDERIAVATVFGVEQLVKAIVAGGQIGGNQRGLLGVVIVGKADVERAEPLQRHLLEIDFLDLCGGRGVHVQLGDELVQQARLALGMDEHAFHSVEHPAVELVFLR